MPTHCIRRKQIAKRKNNSRMAKAVKQHGRVYTPDYLVKTILDFGGYDNPDVLRKHVIDNSCGDGAFLTEIVRRYCSLFLSRKQDLSELRKNLETGLRLFRTVLGKWQNISQRLWMVSCWTVVRSVLG